MGGGGVLPGLIGGRPGLEKSKEFSAAIAGAPRCWAKAGEEAVNQVSTPSNMYYGLKSDLSCLSLIITSPCASATKQVDRLCEPAEAAKCKSQSKQSLFRSSSNTSHRFEVCFEGRSVPNVVRRAKERPSRWLWNVFLWAVSCKFED